MSDFGGFREAGTRHCRRNVLLEVGSVSHTFASKTEAIVLASASGVRWPPVL